jgi:fructokinase
MFIGIDWGGTKIEGVALTKEGKEMIRLRQDTPRHDYHGCIGVIANLVECIEREMGQTGSVGIGIPGSLEPKSRLGKGASSTWLIGRPVEKDLRAALGREIRVENDADCLAAS